MDSACTTLSQFVGTERIQYVDSDSQSVRGAETLLRYDDGDHGPEGAG